MGVGRVAWENKRIIAKSVGCDAVAAFIRYLNVQCALSSQLFQTNLLVFTVYGATLVEMNIAF